MDFEAFNGEYGRLYKEEDNLYHRLAKHFGLSDSAFWIIYTLEAAQSPLSQTEMCSYLALSKQTINSALKQLEREGFIQPFEAPGRRKYLELTSKGRALAEHTARKVLELEKRTFLALSEEERASLLALSRRHLELLVQEAKQILHTPQEELYDNQII